MAANQQNAQHSTGPSAEGAQRSKFNSTTHGMSGSGDALPKSDHAKAKERFDQICASRFPFNSLEFHVIWRISMHWILHDMCERRLALIYTNESHRACWDWEEMCRATVQEQIGLLAHNPVRAIALLLQSPQGCQALISQWKGLEGFLRKNGCWTKPQQARAFDLLGVDPVMRDSGTTEFDPQPGDGTTFQSRAQQVIARELAQLQERAESPPLHRTWERQREHTIAKLKVLDSREARLAERYRAEQARRLRWWSGVLEKLQSKPGRERSQESQAHSAKLAKKMKYDETLEILRNAGVLKEGQEPPEWVQSAMTEKHLDEAEEKFAQFGALKAAAEASAKAVRADIAAKAKAAREAKAAGKVNAEVAEVLDNGPVIPAAATSSCDAPQAPEHASAPKQDQKPKKPLSRRKRRQQELRDRQEERRQQQSFASAYNGSPNGTAEAPKPPPAG
jgi:hypothetical protein